MYIQLVVIGSILMGFLSAQLEMNYSYEMQYGNGLEEKTGEKYQDEAEANYKCRRQTSSLYGKWR